MAMGRIALEGGARVVARSDFRLGFDNPSHKEFRDQLRAACRGLSPRPRQVLRAAYSSAIAGDLVDVENVTTYNLGTSCLAHAATEGLVIERSMTLAPDGRFEQELRHELSYEVTADASWRHWTVGPPVYEVVMPQAACARSATARGAWVAARRAELRVHRASSSGPILTELTVGSDVKGVGLLSVMKPLVDGLLAAGHSYAGSEDSELLVRASNISGSLTTDELAQWLAPWASPLGPWRFIFPRGEGVQVSPADDRIVGLRLTRSEQPGLRFAVSEAVAA